MRGSIRRVVAVCLAAVLVTSACGDDPAVTADGGPASTTTAPAEGTTTTEAPGSSTTSPMGDARIVRATDLTPEPIPSPPDRLVELVEQTAEPLPLADRANLVPESEASDDPTTYVTTYLDKVMQNADAVWAEWMVRVGYQRPAVGYVVVQDGDVYQSNCIIAGQPMVIEADTPNAYYCPVDVVVEGFQGAIWMPVLTMYKMWNGDIFGRQAAASGDFAAAVLAAHEFGHHVADELAIQSGVAPRPASGPSRSRTAWPACGRPACTTRACWRRAT